MRVDVPRSALAAAIAAMLALAGCGSAGSSGDGSNAKLQDAAAKAKKAARSTKVTPRATAQGVVLTRDPEEDQSFPLPAGTRGAQKAPTPDDAPDAPRRKASTAQSEISPGAPSDAEIRRELKQMEQAIKDFKRGSRGAGSAAVRAAVTTAATPRRPSARPT